MVMRSRRKGGGPVSARAKPVFFRSPPGGPAWPTSGSLLKALLVVGAGLWIFSPAFMGGWLWDDDRYISDNPIIQDPEGFWKVWVNPDGQGSYYPLTSFVEWLQWQWWGNNTLGYHLTSVFLHLTGAFLIWHLFARLGIRLAWLGALFFTVHPAMIESVAWISELKNTLSLPPLLLAMLALLTWTEIGGRRSYLAALALFIVATLAKTSGVMLPVVLLGYIWAKRGRIGWADLRAAAPFFVVSAVAGGVTLMPHNGPGSDEVQKTWDLLPALAGVGWSIFFLFGKCVFPFHLLPVYEGLAVTSPAALDVMPWLLLAGLAYLLGINRAGWSRCLLLGLGFFLVNLVPVLLQVFVSYSTMLWSMEHMVYIPIIGLIGLAVVGLGFLDRRLPSAARIAQWVAVSGVAALMAWSGHAYAGWFADREVFWNTLAQRDPRSSTAEINLAMIRIKDKRYSEAGVHLRKALALRPDLDDAHYANGLVLEHTGHVPEAEEEFRRALSINPRYAGSYLALGYIQKNEGHLAEAEKLYAQGLKIAPDDVSLLTDMAGLLLVSGRVSEATGLYRHAVDLDPSLAQLQFDLGKALLQQGNFSDAGDHFAKAAELDPTLAPAHVNLGVIFAQSGRLPEAIDQFQAALQVDTTLVEARLNLALALAQSGRIPEAIDQFNSVLRLDPNNAKARDSLAKLQQLELQQNAPAKK